MDPDEISYKILRHIQQSEQKTPTLTKIRPRFYELLNTYLTELETIVTNETSPYKKQLYQEELKNTKKITTNIYELREKKIVQAALSTVRGAQPDLNQLLPQEQNLLNTLISTIQDGRNTILTQDTQSEPSNNEPENTPTPSIEKPKKAPETPSPQANTSLIRITKDLPAFVGTDMQTYNLKKEDVLSLPTDTAQLLIKQQAAILIK